MSDKSKTLNNLEPEGFLSVCYSEMKQKLQIHPTQNYFKKKIFDRFNETVRSLNKFCATEKEEKSK